MAWGDGAWAPPRKAAPAWLRASARRTLDLLLPPTALDGGPRPFAPGLSPGAWGRITWIEEPACDGCGAPRPFAEPGRCLACEARPRAYDRARAACLYDAASRVSDAIELDSFGDGSEGFCAKPTNSHFRSADSLSRQRHSRGLTITGSARPQGRAGVPSRGRPACRYDC